MRSGRKKVVVLSSESLPKELPTPCEVWERKNFDIARRSSTYPAFRYAVVLSVTEVRDVGPLRGDVRVKGVELDSSYQVVRWGPSSSVPLRAISKMSEFHTKFRPTGIRLSVDIVRRD